MRFERLQIQERFVYVEYQNSRHAFILHAGAMGQPTCFRADGAGQQRVPIAETAGLSRVLQAR
jgi:hypothetical protein